MMMQNPYVFFSFAGLILFFSLGLLLSKSPLKSALFLVAAMVGTGFVYMLLGAYFLAMVQIAVYAGAVMVLFIMVLMLIGEKQDQDENYKQSFSTLIKLGLIALVLGLMGGVFSLKSYSLSLEAESLNLSQSVKEVAFVLFENHVFVFEIIGLVLLVMAVAVVTISKAVESQDARD